jgi:glycosyltransferase involved in cell wall biosynthesis
VKLDDDLDQLVRDARGTGRGRLTAAGYLRLNLLYDGCRGWLLVVVPMPSARDDALGKELHRNRDVVVTTTVLFLKQALNRAGEPGDFGDPLQEVTEGGQTAFTYRWVPDPVLERSEVSTNVLFDTLCTTSPTAGRSPVERTRAMSPLMAVQLHSWMGAIEEPTPGGARRGRRMLGPLDRDLYLFSCTLSSADRASYTLEKMEKLLRPRAFYTMFERLRVEPRLATQLNASTDAVMVPCSANRDALVAAGAERVNYVPYPYFPDDHHLALPPPRREPRVFYWIGRWEPRKAPHNLIRAFLLAFKPGEAELHLKIGHVPWPGYPEPEEAIAEALSDSRIARAWTTVRQVDEAVRVLRGRWPAPEVVALHARGDVYASASRGEGIDLPSRHAKIAGRRIVTTDSGGPRDHLTETDVLVPKTGEVPAEARYRWGPGAALADYDVDALAAALQVARTRPPERISESFRVTTSRRC